jgi:hypothetical protein
MRFTAYQYDKAIEALTNAKTQLEPDGNCCAVCGDSGHMAFECGHNPLFAVSMCEQIAKQSRDLHETLHSLGGWDFAFGEQLGPAKACLPAASEAEEWQGGPVG